MMPRVSSTLRVVCVRNASFVSGPNGSFSTSASLSTRTIACGASPIVPMTSSCPSWPIRTIVYPSRAYLIASRCTLVTSGQVASIARRSRSAASRRIAGETPWALNSTVWPFGTSCSPSTKTTPRLRNRSTIGRLWTISWNT